MYARFTAGLRGFLKHPITLAQSRAIIRRRLDEREEYFLRILERGAYGYPASPYLPLLREAQCEMPDIASMVRNRGIEHTLEILYDSGVRISFEQFKGREALGRDGRLPEQRAGDFDNPYRKEHYRTESGGSTGVGTRISHDLDHLAAQAPHLMLTLHVHGVYGLPTALWRGILPDGSGINNVLRGAHYGSVPKKWFSPVVSLKPSVKYRLATYYTVAMSRLFGVPLPWPEMVPIKDAAVVARWAVDTLETHGSCLILATVSRALRICMAADDEGWNLTGATFMVAGEPPTPAKMEGITRTGARYFPTYGLAESGRMGMGCGAPVECNDLHLLTDAFAVIQRDCAVPGADMKVPALAVTSLLPSTPKLMLNVEIDDYGTLENRSCGCPLEECGLRTHVRGIRSFRKLTGEGVTLVGSEMVEVLEQVLPDRFGGSPLDYQLQEEEDERGFTRLNLVVHPRLAIESEKVVIDAVIDALGRGSAGADSARAIWRQADTLRVKRTEPVWTERGKYMPLRVARNPGAASGNKPDHDPVRKQPVGRNQ
jgi:hypothetical protein